jgi:hypothetical protein
MLRVPNVQNILGVTFAASLINVSTAVIGAQIGVDLERDSQYYTISDSGIIVLGKGQRVIV